MTDTTERSFETVLMQRLDDSPLPEAAENLILAAMIGGEELAATLGGAPPPTSPVDQDPTATPATAWLTRIEVAGFRGIGPATTLDIEPRAGLTLIVGRNGCGKSSFAEAAELVLTGDSRRWAGRTGVWKEGWRNLHTDGDSYIRVGLAIDRKRPATAERHWTRTDDLDGATSFVQVTGEKRASVSALGWDVPMDLYRPFLSYSELGGLLAGKPSEMYDSLQRILGLDALVVLEKRLKAARKNLQDIEKHAKAELPKLLHVLGGHADPRARDAEKAVNRRTADLEQLERLAQGEETGDDTLQRSLRQLAALTVPEPSEVERLAVVLTQTRQRIAELQATPAADGDRLAGLLRDALAYHASHPDEPCPVCQGRTLDAAWAGRARGEVERLDRLAAEWRETTQRRHTALHELGLLLPRLPDVLRSEQPADIDLAAARAAWEDCAALLETADADRIEAEAPTRFAHLAQTATAVREAAEQALHHHRQAWQPAADAIREWVAAAREGLRAKENLKVLKAALEWLSGVGQELRDQQISPIATQAKEIWTMLRQQSNVDLGSVRLAGTGTSRHLRLDVTLDGEPGAALAVMSQGELHALALSLFLPRATSNRSPFRFLVIDDPVQSMDPAKVYGLARVLAAVAKDRQVVVFTHDDRLPQAVRQLGLDATIHEVVRGERSVVQVRRSQDPVSSYLEDAMAVAKSEQLDEESRVAVVAMLLRIAVEAACHETYRRRKLQAAVPHAAIEDALTKVSGLRPTLALALFDDPRRSSDVAAQVQKLHGIAPGVLTALNKGAHGEYRGRLTDLVYDGRRLAAAVRNR